MKTLSLNGTWALHKIGSDMTCEATVPGSIHTDLLKAELIKDPFYRDQEFDQFWVGDADWTLARTITVDSQFLQHDRVILRCNGLDTLATILLNGHEVGSTDNMHRTWEFDVKPLLQVGENTIDVRFASAVAFTEKKDRARHLPRWPRSWS